MPEIVESAHQTIDRITREIIHYEDMARSRAGDAIRFKVLVGQRLTEAKDALPHGEFAPYLETHFRQSVQWARKHMALAKLAKGKSTFHLDDEALRTAWATMMNPARQIEAGTPKTERPRFVFVLSTGEEAVLKLEEGEVGLALDEFAGMKYRACSVRGVAVKEQVEA